MDLAHWSLLGALAMVVAMAVAGFGFLCLLAKPLRDRCRARPPAGVAPSAPAALARFPPRDMGVEPARRVRRRAPGLAELRVADHGLLPAARSVGGGLGARPFAFGREELRHVAVRPERLAQALARGAAVALTPEDREGAAIAPERGRQIGR